MERIITLTVGGQSISIFTDVLAAHSIGSPCHSHRYPEVHIFISGEGSYLVGGQTYPMQAGDVLLIPAGVLHETSCSQGGRVMGFEIDVKAEHLRMFRLPAPLIEELDACRGGDLDGKMPALYYLLAQITGEELYTVSPNEDVAYLIDAYLEKNYHRPVRLAELSAALCLSNRQTERIIKALTGNTFGELLTAHRLAVAERLAATTDMKMSEIAAYVGFSTYSGFRRAWLRARGRGK
jgi:AraC-like DNA-binding protein